MTRINQFGWLSTPHRFESSLYMSLMTVKKNQSCMHPAVSQQVSKIILWSRKKLWQLFLALRNSINTCLKGVFIALRTIDLSPCCWVLNLVFLCWPHPACNVGLHNCQLVSMTLNTGLPRIVSTLSRLSRKIGASRLIKSTAFKFPTKLSCKFVSHLFIVVICYSFIYCCNFYFVINYLLSIHNFNRTGS